MKLDLCNCATKFEKCNSFWYIKLRKTDLANLKSNVDGLDIDKLKKLSTGLNNFKKKVNKLDVDKLVLFLLI